MIQENEIVMLLLGIGVLFFLRGNRHQIARFPSSKYLVTGFHLFLVGWILTVLEGFFLSDVLNILEHAFYAFSAVFLTRFCWRIFGAKEEIS